MDPDNKFKNMSYVQYIKDLERVGFKEVAIKSVEDKRNPFKNYDLIFSRKPELSRSRPGEIGVAKF